MLGGLRARLDDDPILVVPTFSDVEHSQRELAERGAVFGARVMRFDWLFGRSPRAPGFGAPRGVGLPARADRGGRGAARASSRVLAESAAQPGFVRAAARFVARADAARMVEPAALDPGAPRSGRATGPRRAYAEEVAAVYRALPRRAGGRGPGRPGAVRVAGARRAPRGAGPGAATPLFVYGFDDFTPLEIARSTRSRTACGADVTVSLPYEPGRLAFKAVAGDAPGAARARRRGARAGAARRPLRGRVARGAPPRRAPPVRGRAGRAASSPGARSRSTPPAASAPRWSWRRRACSSCSATGVEPGDVAVVFRDPVRYSSLLEQVFGAYGIPYSIDRTLPFGHTGLGRGLLALIRARRARRQRRRPAHLPAHARAAAGARASPTASRPRCAATARTAPPRRASCWERDHWPLDELDRLRAARATPAAFVAELEARLARLFAAPYERTRHRARAARSSRRRARSSTAQRALAELRSVLGGQAASTRRTCCACWSSSRCTLGETPQPDRVQVATPEAIRARRFEAVFACGLQEGEFPRGASPEPFLSDEDRRAIATASGLALPVREDRLDRERYLFYVCASRAERLLVLSSRSSDEEGNPADRVLLRGRRARAAGGRRRAPHALALRRDLAPGRRAHGRRVGPRARGQRPAPPGAGPPRRSARRRCSRSWPARDAVAARALENFADCPVKWLVEDLLRPDELDARPRGDGARLLRPRGARATPTRRLHEETGERRVTPGNLGTGRAHPARGAARAKRRLPALAEADARARGGAAARVRPAALPALGGGLGQPFEPVELERQFGLEGSEPVELEGGLRVRGRIDRVDDCDGMALVIDYKTGKKVDRYKVASWEPENRFQAALYMLVVEKLLGPPRGRRRVRGARQRRPAPARDGGRRTSTSSASAGSTSDRLGARGVPREARLGARAHPRDGRAHARRRALLAARTAATGTAAASTRRCAGASGEGADTAEQRRAVERRDGSLLVRAGAGTGKTTVLVERFVQAVTEDGIEVEQVLAITFTEKAAAEMRARVRRRFLELGRREDARAAESAWISTIHGLCAQDPARARAQRGHRPRLPRARRGGRRAHRRRRLRRGARGVHGRGRLRTRPRPRRDGRRVHARTACATWSAPPTRTSAARGERHPRLEESLPPRPAGEAERLEDAARAALAELAMAGGGVSVEQGDRDDRAARRAEERQREGALHRRLPGVPRRVRRARRGRGGGARAPRPHDAACAARALRRALRPRQARPLGARLRGPRARGARPARRRRGAPRGLLVALRARAGGRVPGHEPAPERAAGPALAGEPVQGRRREPVDLPLPERGRRRVPRALGGGPCGGPRREHHGELPRARRAARRDRPRIRAAPGTRLRAAPRGARVERSRPRASSPAWTCSWWTRAATPGRS